jgi:sirohydrochlorin ferrochelatase
MTATLIACSHGTSDESGRAAIAALVEQTRALVPGIRVEAAFVDVEEPAVDAVVDRCATDGPVVVVPLLLSTGFHTKVDIARAVGAHHGRAVAAPALGPHDLLVDVLQSRLAEIAPHDGVVLAAAGSSDPAAAVDVQAVAAQLGARLQRPVHVGFAAGAGQRIPDAVAQARRDGAARVGIASYVLAPGFFARVIASAGGDAVTAPLAPDPRLAAVVVERYRQAAAHLAA